MVHLSAVSSSALASAQSIRSSVDIQDSRRAAAVGQAMAKASIVFFAALAVIVSFVTMPMIPALIASVVILSVAGILASCIGPSEGVVVNRPRPLIVSQPQPARSVLRGISTWSNLFRTAPAQPVRYAPSSAPLQGSSALARTQPGGGHFAQPARSFVATEVPAAPGRRAIFIQPAGSGGARIQPGSGR